MTLADLLRDAEVEPDASSGEAQLTDLTPDSRRVRVGSLFVCMPSARGDSHLYIESAVQAGATAVLTHSDEGYAMARNRVAAILIRNDGRRFDEALWRLARTFFRYPTRDMKVVGVTGTNGKTTVAWLARQMLSGVGEPSAYLGTLGFYLPGSGSPIDNTTPFSPDLNRMLAHAREAGVRALAIEISSHALAQRRADGVELDVGVFTNLSRDHLDFHGNLHVYEAIKRRMFEEFPRQTQKPFVAALNVDDPAGRRWAEMLTARKLTYGFKGGELRAEALEVRLDRVAFSFEYQGRRWEAEAGLGGAFNLWNCLSATAAFLALGYQPDRAVEQLSRVKPAPGRFETVRNRAGIGVLVDYAHTPDAIEKLLDSARELTGGKIIAVFGCGGDRDRGKRPEMAKAAAERADMTVVTSDNPRTEDPQTILDQIVAGMPDGREYVVVTDRRAAIERALALAGKEDVVVIAGKGHENYQIVGNEKRHFDDREVVLETLGAPR
jgi:UDP-N-acetylmuramyl-tripeptide synthetase